jgi:hypothetical protein
MDDVQLDDLMTRTMHRLESDETLSGSAGSTEMYLLLQLRCRHSLHALQSALGSWIHTTVAKYSRLMRIKQRRQEGKAPASTETEEGEDTDLAAVVQECGHIRTLATSALSAIKRLQVYHNESVEADSGESLGGGVGDITSHTESAALAFAFNPALAKMVLVSPLRHVRLRKFSESLTYLAKMCEEVIGVTVTACQLLDAHLTLTYDELLGVSLGLSESRPHVLARSLYLAVMYSLSPTLHLMLQRSMLWHALPNSIVRCELVTQQWLPENPSSAAWETIKLLCSNRNTIPARMDQALSLWGAVSNDAVFVDEKFRIDNEIPDVQQWCSSWALVQTAGVMDLHMALLVESDVLGVQELDYFFWYWDYICTTKSFALGKLRDQRFSLDEAVFSSATERWRASEAEKAVTGKANKKKNNSKGSKDKSPVPSSPAPNLPTPSKRPLTVDEMMVSGRAQLCRALFRMAIVCGQVGLVDKAENRFMSWDCRFELRFKAFRNINNPPMLSHADFYRTVHSRGSEQSQSAAEVPIDVHPVLTGAGVCFQNARKYLDEVRRMPVTHQADLLAQNKALVLTKVFCMMFASLLACLTSFPVQVAVANSLSLMKASKLIPRPQAEQRLSPLQHRLGVNLSYDKHHPVLEVAVMV